MEDSKKRGQTTVDDLTNQTKDEFDFEQELRKLDEDYDLKSDKYFNPNGRRKEERRSGDRRVSQQPFEGEDRRKSDRRSDERRSEERTDRRNTDERRQSERSVAEAQAKKAEKKAKIDAKAKEILELQETQIKELTKQNESLQKQVAELKESLLKNQAETQNFKRRVNDEKIKDRKYATQSVMSDLVDIIDNYKKAIDFKTDSKELQNFLYGFKMFYDQFNNILTSEQVVEIDAMDKHYDPKVHHAMEKVFVEGKEHETVVEVLQRGYMFKDRVLRPAVVKINDINLKK